MAGFIGSPKMNFLEGENAEKYGAHAVGIRPEHFIVSKENGTWQGTVSVTEHLGSDTFIRIHLDNNILTARVSGEIDVQHGDNVFLDVYPEHIYKFDQAGLAIS